MSKQTSITTLRRYSFFAWCASLLLIVFGVISLLLFIRPSLIGVNPGSTSSYEGNLIWPVVGVLFVILGMVFQSVAYRWPRHLLSVLNSHITKPMLLQIEIDEGSDHTQYYAWLSDDTTGDSEKGWRVGLWASSRNTRGLIGNKLSTIVFFDPQTGEPAVIEDANGYLWAMKGDVTSCPVDRVGSNSYLPKSK
jgi:hypothetical protein